LRVPHRSHRVTAKRKKQGETAAHERHGCPTAKAHLAG